MRNCFKRLLAASAAMVSTASWSAVIQLQNPDFESGVQLSDGAYEAQHIRPIVGWTTSGGSSTGRWNPTKADFTDEANYQLVGFASQSGLSISASAGMLGQRVAGETLKANTRYTLSADVGNYFSNANRGYTLGLISQFGTLAARVLVQSSAQLGPKGTFQRVQLVFETGNQTYGVGKDITIGLASAGSGGGGATFDNIRLEANSLAAVPEPATWAMMIAGFGAIGAAARQRPLRPIARA
jgi:hypothetical protein